MKSFSEQAAENKPSLWISVSLLWGTVFFFTSLYFLSMFSDGAFSPSVADSAKAYLIYAVLIVIVALTGFAVNKLYDPTGEKRARRQSEVKSGQKEQIFVSLVGSLATGFGFCLVTVLAFWLATFFGVAAAFNGQTILYAALANIGAGLGASLFTGGIFLILKSLGKFPTPAEKV
jgi:hypothetical protein